MEESSSQKSPVSAHICIWGMSKNGLLGKYLTLVMASYLCSLEYHGDELEMAED